MVIRGEVIKGNGIGGQLGYPTANITAPQGAPQGVWAARVEVCGTSYGALVSIGTRSTVVEDGELLVEAHLLGFNGDLYNKEITVELLDFIRPQRHFDTIDELRRAIAEDAQKISLIIEH